MSRKSKEKYEWDYSTYSKVDPQIRSYFPFSSPRPQQLETISEIHEAIEKGYKYIVLEAGTGTGKSAIAATLAMCYGDAYILTMTKQLQRQYTKDFEDYDFALVKGRSNFDCLKYMEEAIEESCDMGRCVLEGHKCSYKVNQFNLYKKDPGECCPYFHQRAIALNSDIVITNYSYLFAELNFNNDFKAKRLLICDEAHNLESKIMDLISLEFTRRQLKDEVGINLSKETLKDLEEKGYTSWLQFIKRVCERYGDKSKETKKALGKRKSLTLHRRSENLKRRLEDFKRFSNYIAIDPDNWIMDYDPHSQRLSFKPIRIDKYANEVLLKHADVCIFMSGTILNHHQFAKWLGIEEDEIYPIRRKSPFDIRRNPIRTYAGFDMTYRNLGSSAKKSVPVIREILERHKGEKGIIHTVSYQCKEFLKKELNNPRLLDHETKDREKVLERFKKSDEPLVLISPSMNEGVDLPGDLCRFQIIYKIPYPNISDKQTNIRRKKERIWYDYQTAINLVQTYGRGMRSEDDYCTTYFIDSRIKSYLKRDSIRNNLIPDFFKEAVDVEAVEIEKSPIRKASDATSIAKYEDSDSSKSSVDLKDSSSDSSNEDKSSKVDDSDFKTPNDSKTTFKKSDVRTKYALMKKGKDLARTNMQEAIAFYKSLLMHKCFKNDYYPYIKLVVLYDKTKDYKNELGLIKFFFNRGIYCPRYYYFWFLNKLLKLSERDLISKEEINELEKEYMSKGFKNKSIQSSSMIIADRIEHYYGDTYVLSEHKFNNKLKSKEIIEEGKYFERTGNYQKAIDLYSEAIFDRHFNNYSFYQRICFSLEELEDYERELEYINSYFDNDNIKKSETSEKWFNKRLDKVNGLLELKRNEKDIIADVSDSSSSKISSDNDSSSSSDEDSIFNPSNIDLMEYDDSLSLEDNIQRKMELKEHAMELRRNKNYSELISFLKALTKNSYFENDYYPFRHLCSIYEQIKHYSSMKDSIKDMLYADVYLTDYQLVWLKSKREIADAQIGIDEGLFNQWIDHYKSHGARNKSKANSPVSLADRLIKKDENYTVSTPEEFDFTQKKYELTEKGRSLERKGRYEEAAEFYMNIIKEKKYHHYDFYKRLCFSLDEIPDYERELKAIKLYYTCPPIFTDDSSDRWFEKRLEKVNSKI